MGNLLVVLDSNVIISSLLHSNGNSSRVIELWRKQYFQVLISNYILSEIKDALRDKQLGQKYHLSSSKQARLLTQLYHSGQISDPISPFAPTSRDPKDNLIIQLALTGHADYLVTGDKDLLVLAGHKSIKPLKIITPHDFLQKFMSSDEIMEEYLEKREQS